MRERWKAPRKGDEIVSETVWLQGVRVWIYPDDGVPIEEWANECAVRRLVKSSGTKL